MLIVGAGGYAKEVLEVVLELNFEKICFFEEEKYKKESHIFGKYLILNNDEDVKTLFLIDNRFVLGVGDPILRNKFLTKFMTLGGEPYNLISKSSSIGNFKVTFGKGICIMQNVIITTSVRIGDGVLININSTVGHDCVIGDFVIINPGVNISGNCRIDDHCVIGTNATLIPHISIGKRSIIGAGSVIIRNVESDLLIVGNPGKVKKKIR